MGLKRVDGVVRNGCSSAQGDLMNPRCSNCKVATRASSLDQRPAKYRHRVCITRRYFESPVWLRLGVDSGRRGRHSHQRTRQEDPASSRPCLSSLYFGSIVQNGDSSRWALVPGTWLGAVLARLSLGV